MDLDVGTRAVLMTVYPDLKVRMIRVYNDVFTNLGFPMRATSGMRSIPEQLTLWKKGRDEEGQIIDPHQVVTQAPPGSSIHNYGLAVDSCFHGDDPYWEYLKLRDGGEYRRRWAAFGKVCESHGLVWGGMFASITDLPHAQITYGMSLKDIQTLYKFKGLPAVWTKCDQIRGVKPAVWEDVDPPPAA